MEHYEFFIHPSETQLVERLGEIWNAFRLLPEIHPSDVVEFQAHLHALQNIILSRAAMRQLGWPRPKT